MLRIMDKPDPIPGRLGLEHGPVPRWLLIAHRIVTVAVLFLIVFAVLTLIAAIVFGGHSLATRLLFLWHHVDSIWT